MSRATKKVAEGVYYIDGTDLAVSRDEAPRYGRPQTWSISPRGNLQMILLTGTSKQNALDRMDLLLKHWSGQ